MCQPLPAISFQNVTKRYVSGLLATIRDITYAGAGWRVALELSDGQSLLASMMRGDDVAGRLAPGLPVVAQWAPVSVAVLPTEGSS